MRRLLTSVVVSAFVAGCGTAPTDDGLAWTSRDSAGIEIVENHGAANLVAKPGVADSTGRALDLGELLYVRHLFPLSDSALIIGGGGQGGLNWVDLQTGAVRLLGGVGQGPGEYSGAAATYRCNGDTLLVQTYPSRLSWLDPSGEFVRLRERPAFRYSTLAVASDCSAALTLSSARVPSSGPLPDGEIRLTWHDLATDSAKVIASLPIPRPELVQAGGRELPLSPPYASLPLFTGRGDLALIGVGERPEVQVYDRTRGLVRIIRWDAAAVAVTAQDAEQYDAILAYRGATYGEDEVSGLPSGVRLRLALDQTVLLTTAGGRGRTPLGPAVSRCVGAVREAGWLPVRQGACPLVGLRAKRGASRSVHHTSQRLSEFHQRLPPVRDSGPIAWIWSM